MKSRYLWPAVAGLVAALSACGGGGGDTPPPAADPLFTPQNAWPGPRPADAETITPEAFRQGIASGDLVLIGPARTTAQRAARAARVSEDRAYLAALPSPSPVVQALLAEAAGDAVHDDAPATIGGQAVTLLGLDTRLREAVFNHQRNQRADNALAVYSQAHALLSRSEERRVGKECRL